MAVSWTAVAVIAAITFIIVAFIVITALTWNIVNRIVSALGDAWGNLGTTGQTAILIIAIGAAVLIGGLLLLSLVGASVSASKKGVSTTASKRNPIQAGYKGAKVSI